MNFSVNNKDITILIADDEPTNRFIIKSFLKQEGYNILEAKNGFEAVECLKWMDLKLLNRLKT